MLAVGGCRAPQGAHQIVGGCQGRCRRVNATGENGEPWNTSLGLMPLAIKSLWAASISETISAPRIEPGAANVTPLPNETGHRDPGGV